MTFNTQLIRTRLEAKRAELQHEIDELIGEESSSSQRDQGVEDSGETAQDIQEIQREQSILQNQRLLITEVEEALKRLQDGTYGRCQSCGQPIPAQRLEAIPWATRDVACEAKEES